MRIATIVLMALVCAAQTACVTQHEAIPPETRAELIRLGRIIIDENEAEETRSKAQVRYGHIVWDAMEKYGKKSVDRQTIIDSFVVGGQKPKGLTFDDWTLDYMFECKDGTLGGLCVYFGGWTGSYVQALALGGGIP